MEINQLRTILENLTLEEKIGQLVQLSGEFFSQDKTMIVGPSEKLGIKEEFIPNVGSVLNVIGREKIKKIQSEYLASSRHKIPLLFMGDIIYGYKTVFPIPLGIGATWNPELIEDAYNIISSEAVSEGAHVTFAPMVDLVRDPRWGRSLESTGEDVTLNSVFAKAMVTGLQKNLDEENGLVSCIKHFAGYGAAEGGRDYNTVDMSEREFRQNYLPSFKAGLDAGANMIMTSFNTVNGVPSTGNKWLINDLLRKEWGFEGVTIADYAAVRELIDHGVASDEREATKLAIEATVDIDMKTNCYASQLAPLIEDGGVDLKLVDESVWRVLLLKNKLGLFENPYRGIDNNITIDIDRNFAKAKEVAEQSIVLLQNKNNILPLNSKQKISLIGPYADSKSIMGLWAVYGQEEDCTTIKESIIKRSELKMNYALGTEIIEDVNELGEFGSHSYKGTENTIERQKQLRDQAIKIAKESDVIVLALGEHTLQSGEAGSRTELRLPEVQMKLLDELSKLDKPIVLVLFNGRPLVLTDIVDKVDAVVEAWFPGTEGGNAIVNILFGKTNPSGKLSMSFPFNEGQIPVYYNHYSTGRPKETSNHSGRFVSKYLDAPNEPLYPFGYGLSYSSFKYTNLELSDSQMTKNTHIDLKIEVTNNSDIDGFETIQLYIRDIKGSVVRPVKELKDFKKVFVKAGETVIVNFSIKESQLRFFNQELLWTSENGEFEVMVGTNSKDLLVEKFVLSS